ncbi:transglutaminase domain-containing protein [Cytobacillus kochii]|uniref:transglutaminase domain-containing protein n=1 Tax=Cytobacillus kochii TaxID=859143 RepID=UPI00203BF72B|nr:transglutaminase-like domain-containing protein [Cytobacillus kochii]MCM3324872.1 transglutaminase-like domain-containing protein [Cytobacillus kochii]MCM3347265.1 transglutaminase-like domain-containing protein [Cytobacillus kochii]
MLKRVSLFPILLVMAGMLLIGCNDKGAVSSEEVKKQVDPYEQLVEEKNKELELEPLTLTTYSDEIGATFDSPEYREFAANGTVTIEGSIEDYRGLKSGYAWISVTAEEDGVAGREHEYYAPIKEGQIKQDIQFFNGEGTYHIKVQLPDDERENYYYDTARFTVHNVNPDVKRDVTYTPYGQEVGLSLGLDTSFFEAEEVFPLKGVAEGLDEEDTVMLRVSKGTDNWNHVLAVNQEHQFDYEVPLFYGEGLHKVEVMVPDGDRENYYQTATTLMVNNTSQQTMEPIEYSSLYNERGVTLETPAYSGDESSGDYTISGMIQPEAELASETTHLYVSSKKGEDTALDVIPVQDFRFDDSFYLRFGPGTYDITVSVPEITKENSDTFRFYSVAKFQVDNTGEDRRDLLPSRGVQSDHPKINSLAEELLQGVEGDREKAKAIYDYVAEHIAYDVEKYNTDDFHWDDSALKALETKKGVCQDYAYLAIALLRASDMEARFVEGNAGSGFTRGALGGRHAWVEVKVDGEWLTMDPTWGSGYVENDTFVAAYNEDYFDPEQASFEETHYRTGISY